MKIFEKAEQKKVWFSPELKTYRSIIRWKQGKMHKNYEILPGESYANRRLMDAKEGNSQIASIVRGGGGI